MINKLLTIAFGLALLLGAAPLRAAVGGSISIYDAPTGQTPDECSHVNIEYQIQFTFTTDDGDGKDWVAVTMMDSSGVPLDTDFYGVPFGSVSHIDTFDGKRPEAITSRPIIFTLYDIGNPAGIKDNTLAGFNFASKGTLLRQMAFDPGLLTTNNTCESLPLKSVKLKQPTDITNPCRVIPRNVSIGILLLPVRGYDSPGRVSPTTIIEPGPHWVFGQDHSGQYYLILQECDLIWVPANVLLPVGQAPWSEQPLPTQIVG